MEPSISLASAHLLGLLFASAYVGSIYASKGGRLSFQSTLQRGRDDPDVIRTRLIAVSFATLANIAIVFTVLLNIRDDSANTLDILQQTIKGLGIYPSHNWTVYFITPVLYTGPLLSMLLSKTLPGQSQWRGASHIFCSLIGWRNYIVAPITEEIVFRSCVILCYHLAGASNLKIVFLTPLTFGLAHAHHAWEIYNNLGRTKHALKTALLTSLFQLGFTSIFGFYVAYLFLRTGSILPSIAAHIFCNIMGLPTLGDDMKTFPRIKYLVLVAYLSGIAGFASVLAPCSRSKESLYWP